MVAASNSWLSLEFGIKSLHVALKFALRPTNAPPLTLPNPKVLNVVLKLRHGSGSAPRGLGPGLPAAEPLLARAVTTPWHARLARQVARAQLHITSPSIMASPCHEDHVAHGRHPPTEVT